MKTRLAIFALASSSLIHAALAAPSDAAKQRLETAVGEVLSIASKAADRDTLRKDLRPVLHKYIAFDVMTRRAVGPGWREFTEDQRKKATELFTTLIIRTYSSKFTPGEQPAIEFKAAATPAPGRVEVPTTLSYQGSRYDVIYRLEETEGWRITDVVIEGVSMISTYRTQFDAQFKKGGADAVILSLTQTLDSKK